MDRKQIFPGQIPLETDLLGTNKNVMIALGKLSAAVFGTASCVNGLTVGPNSPAALNVVVQPGELYSLQNIDGTAYSSISADTAHQIVKQGILLDTTTLSTPAPATAGFSINYLIQAAFSEIDTDAVVLPYYNATNPTQAYSGPANAGTTNNTTRKDTIILSAKAGIAATTGTQTTPAADAGYIGLYVVTVANGQTTVTAPNITQLATAPTIPAGIIPAIQSGAYAYAADTGTANAYQASYSPAITALTDGMVLKFKAKVANTGASTFAPNGTTAQPIWGGDHAALTGGEIAANGDVTLEWNSSLNGTGVWVILESTGGYQKGPTPPVGDSSSKLANTAFVTGRLAGIQTFSASGTYTRSTGVKSVIVEVIGAGGGGAGVPTSGVGQITTGGGGGAGGYALKRITSPGATEIVTIGTAGSGGAAGSNAGGNGGTTSFGAWVSATGGTGGATMGGAASNFVAAGGNGGAGSGGDVNYQGQSGAAGIGANPLAVGGTGGTSRFGGGGPGGGTVSSSAAGSTASSGTGAGGGGGATQGGAVQTTGGSGSSGMCIVYEYY